jgi:N,N'-diacetyllegionaminate synthase
MVKLSTIQIGDRAVGDGQPCYIIAEAGVNHNGDIALAKQLVDIAVTAGTNAVKFQTFRAEQVVTPSAPKAPYQMLATDAAESQLDMIRKLELSAEAHQELFVYCADKGITFLSSPFDYESAALLDRLGVEAIKVPSGEITNTPFLKYVAEFRKPILLSTGMSTLADVERAVDTIRGAANNSIVLLHCVSSYPAPTADVNLRAMRTLRSAFGVPTGYSDHTLDPDISIAAVAMGACVIEKHFTVDRKLTGPDHKASLEPDELNALVARIRNVETAMGDGRKCSAECESTTADVARKSLVAARDIAKGETMTDDMIAARRPGTGLSPYLGEKLVGRRAAQDISAGTLLDFEMLHHP